MFHAPASEHKQQTGPARNQRTAQREQGLSPHVTATPGYSWSGSHHSRAQDQFAHIHSTCGNQAVLRMISRSVPAIQAKLTVNQPGDAFEQEADHVANQVMRMTAPGMVQRSGTCQNEDKLQRKCAECEEEKKTGLQRKEASGGPQFAPPSIHQVLNSPGQPLDPATRAFMESRFRHDFGRVRIHTNGVAADTARGVYARAYTVGNDIVFNRSEYAPHTGEGRHLLAHELAHTLQQAGASAALQRQEMTDQDPQQMQADARSTPQADSQPAGFFDCPIWKVRSKDDQYAICQKKSLEFCLPTCKQFPKDSTEELACKNCCWCRVIGCAEGCGNFPNIFPETGCSLPPGTDCSKIG